MRRATPAYPPEYDEPGALWIPYEGLAFPERAFVRGYLTPFGAMAAISPLDIEAMGAATLARMTSIEDVL